MNADSDILTAHLENDFADATVAVSKSERIVEFYEEATVDYGHWSENYNMHLGFYRRGLNFFHRETMLEQMNLEVAERLRIDAENESFLVDLGCGTGAISRTIAKKYSRAKIKGVTLSPFQAAAARKLNEREKLNERIEILQGNYARLSFADETADAAWAVESACYANGAGKEDLVRETARVLKSGGRFAVADCFVKQPSKNFNFLSGKVYRTVCDCWALEEFPTLEKFTAALEKHGFREIVVEEISWRIVPSLVHAPFSVVSFILKKMLAGERLKPHSINNLKASLLALLLGLHRAKIGYYLISAVRE